LKGQVAIISGGLGDIGFAIAQLLASRGADIAIGDRRPTADAEPRLAELTSLGRRANYHQLDVAVATEVNAWVERVSTSFGPPTLVIVNAAIVDPSPVCEITPEQWHRHLDINLSGAFFLAQACANKLRALDRPGRIVFVGSWAADAPHVNLAAYCVAKAGLRMLCRTMALELAPNRILVNEIAPGYVDAGLTAEIWAKHPAKREEGRQDVPTHELITANQVALQVGHLCDPTNRHMTGSTILMDGGLSLTSVATRQRQSEC
jgi:NAD(P)-dependent dehydrogenase (short-subunit alcohol dehydrogenase family)